MKTISGSLEQGDLDRSLPGDVTFGHLRFE